MAHVTPSPDELRSRAVKLQPILAERAPSAALKRRLPDETIADFRQLGFFQILQPSHYGGFEYDPRVFFDVQRLIGAACPSSAWVLGVVAVHNWQLALFPIQAQQDVWGSDTRVLISSSYAPTGEVTRVDDGFQLRGRWSFSSGCDHCDWAFLGGMVPPEQPDVPPEMRTFLVPRSDYRIEDTWHVMGLKATGSKDVVIDDAFVPEYRTHKLIDGFKQRSPGHEQNPAPLFRLPFGQVFVRSVSTTAIGIVEGALEAYRNVTATRIAAGDRGKVSLDPTAQMVCARAMAVVEDARNTLDRSFEEMMSLVNDNQRIPVERRLKFRLDSALVVERCVEAVDALFTQSGGRAIFESSAILRYFLDVHAARAHYANNPSKPGRNFGGVLLQQPNQDYFV